MWLTPEMDINHPPYYSSTSSFSMDKTPLYAACAGNHLEVAEMLVGFGAEVNQRIVEDFPEISSKLVKNCISEQQMEYTLEAGYSEELVHIANYSHKELGGFHDFWISDYKNILVELNISNNHISRCQPTYPGTCRLSRRSTPPVTKSAPSEWILSVPSSVKGWKTFSYKRIN